MGEAKKWDFSGWATKNDLRCADGRTIRKNAFADDDGKTVPLVWMHQHNTPENVLGHAQLENRNEGVYAYCSFNETPSGKQAKEIVQHGDVCSLSIWANNLDQKNGNVMHGTIKEVSVVLAGANPGAVIDFPYFAHSDEEDTSEAFIRVDEPIDLFHAEEEEEDSSDGKKKERTVGDVLESMTDEQRKVTEYLVAQALVADDEDEEKEMKHSDEGDEPEMKYNTFEAFGENTKQDPKTYLTHAEGREIIQLAKNNGVGIKMAMDMYAKQHDKELMHDDLGFRDMSVLFPEYKLVKPGAPEMLTTDQGWISKVLNGVHKSPMTRLRTRQADIRNIEDLRAKGYKKGTLKDFRGNIDLIGRTTDAITVYVKSKLDRDDILDVTDFSIVDYMYQIDRMNLNEELARAIMIGDGRSGDKAIDQTKIRPIWLDDELYTIHKLVDVEGMRTEMNGSDSSKHFGDNYVYAEAVIQSLLYAREKYKGSGSPAFFCHPHLVNVMLLARDLNGRRIYDNVNELKSALNVSEIITVEQFEGKTRQATVDVNGVPTVQTRKILGILVNLADYTVGATRGGEITHFTDFDLNFNQEISLLETRCSGSLLRPWSAIALEELANPQ